MEKPSNIQHLPTLEGKTFQWAEVSEAWQSHRWFFEKHRIFDEKGVGASTKALVNHRLKVLELQQNHWNVIGKAMPGGRINKKNIDRCSVVHLNM